MRFQQQRIQNHSLADPNGYVQTLRTLLADPRLGELKGRDLISEEAASVVLMVAQTLGYCRLFGVAIPAELDGSLPCTATVSAAMTLQTVLADCEIEIVDFADQFHATRTDMEAELLAADWLRVRMDVWATFVAIEEGWRAAMEAGDDRAEQLFEAMDELTKAIACFDVALQRELDLLSVLEQTKLLQNWREMLSEDFRYGLPWWLDGTIERAAEKLRDGQSFVTGELTKTQAIRTVEQVRRYRSVQSLPALDSSESASDLPFDVLKWTSPEATWVAILKIPDRRKDTGRTPCRVVFLGEHQERLDGVLLSLGTARTLVRLEANRETAGKTSVQAIADLTLETLQLEGMEFGLRVCGQLWQESK